MLNVAIIGCGDMGAKHAAAWSKQAQVRIIAVSDVDRDRRERLAAAYGAQSIADWRQAFALAELDAVSVCTPACFHRDIAVAASAGCHVLCEKPMALTLAEADQMIEAAAASDVHLLVSHQYRGLPRYQAIMQLVGEGALGTPLFMRFMDVREVRPKLAMHARRVSGGPVHDMSGHFYDLARMFTGSEAISLTATGHIFGTGKARLVALDDLGIDTAEVQVRFEGGHCLSINICWGLPETSPNYARDVIFGSDGLAFPEASESGDRTEKTSIVVKGRGGTRRIETAAGHPGPEVCVEALIAAIGKRGHVKLNGEAGRAALALILAAQQSIDTGEIVRLREKPDERAFRTGAG